MAQIKGSPPSGTVQGDWPELAIKLYNETTPRSEFKSLAAWKVLSNAPKWIVPLPPPGPLAMSIASMPLSDPASDSGVSTSRASTPPRPMSNKQAKRKHLEESQSEQVEEERLSHLKRDNELAERRVKALEDGTVLAKKMAKADAEAK